MKRATVFFLLMTVVVFGCAEKPGSPNQSATSSVEMANVKGGEVGSGEATTFVSLKVPNMF